MTTTMGFIGNGNRKRGADRAVVLRVEARTFPTPTLQLAFTGASVDRIMKAVGFTEFGGPEVLQVHDLPDPHPGVGEVRIRVRAAAVNPTDISFRTGLFWPGDGRPLYVPGVDAAGVIDELGEGSKWQIGDQVMAMALPSSEHGGAYAEYLIAADDSAARIPAGTSFEQASTLPMNGLTATQILELASLRPGQSIAVTGAAGMVGSYLVQLAKGRA